MNLYVGKTAFQQNNVGWQEKTRIAAHPKLF